MRLLDRFRPPNSPAPKVMEFLTNVVEKPFRNACRLNLKKEENNMTDEEFKEEMRALGIKYRAQVLANAAAQTPKPKPETAASIRLDNFFLKKEIELLEKQESQRMNDEFFKKTGLRMVDVGDE